MARGIGGDDGPTLWMFIAVILVWGKIQGWFAAASDKVDNMANPFQPETTKDIVNKKKIVSSITYRSSKLTHPTAYYQQIADSQHTEMMSRWNIDEDKLLSQLKGLNADELKAVAKMFGVRDSRTFGFATGTGTIFDYYNELLSDSTLGGDDLTQMRNIWKPTGLWAGL